MLGRLFKRLDTTPSPPVETQAGGHAESGKQQPNKSKRENPYERVLGADEIARKAHRAFVGGMWEEIGGLQLEFMKEHGLMPGHDFLDVGCGALRGGLHFIPYLEANRYYGLDLNASLLEAGKKEIEEAGLAQEGVELLASDKFEVHRFGVNFDRALAVSLFTHLPLNPIVRCLSEVGRALKPDGEFYATFFEAPSAAHLEPIKQWGELRTNYDSDPFHYSFAEMEWAANICGLQAQRVGDWGHPRNQRMLLFRR